MLRSKWEGRGIISPLDLTKTKVLKKFVWSSTSKLEREKWEGKSMWLNGDSKNCTVHVNKNSNGSLKDHKITKASLDFVKRLFKQLKDSQIKGAFVASRIEFAPGGAKKVVEDANGHLVEQAVAGGDTVDQWVSSFKVKLDRDIFKAQCGS